MLKLKHCEHFLPFIENVSKGTAINIPLFSFSIFKKSYSVEETTEFCNYILKVLVALLSKLYSSSMHEKVF
jgi:hypothetical protein